MRSKHFIILSLCIILMPSMLGKRKKEQKQNKEPQPVEIIGYTEEQERKDHRTFCNILGHAANIVGNFIGIVRDKDNPQVIGQQVGYIAQNLFNIASEVTKSNLKHKSPQQNTKILEYLSSKAFKDDLEEMIIAQLEQLNEICVK